jgi:hypothetical protein
MAVFDKTGNLLGTAAHKETVAYTQLGYIPTLFRKVTMDFGISKSYAHAALVAVAISDPDVPV